MQCLLFTMKFPSTARGVGSAVVRMPTTTRRTPAHWPRDTFARSSSTAIAQEKTVTDEWNIVNIRYPLDFVVVVVVVVVIGIESMVLFWFGLG